MTYERREDQICGSHWGFACICSRCLRKVHDVEKDKSGASPCLSRQIKPRHRATFTVTIYDLPLTFITESLAK